MGEVWLTDAQAAQAKIELRPLARENVDDTVVTAGRFTFDDARVAHVYSPVNGRVTNIAAALGQRVKPRGPLATIDSPEIGQFSSDVNKAQADLVAAEHDYNRKRDLFANHACSQFDYEQAEDNYRKAQSELDRARQKMLLLHGASGGGVDQRYLVTSPIEGEIIARNISPGIEVQGQYSGSSPVELFTVGELDRVWMLADVYEMDVARVKLDAKVQVSVSSRASWTGSAVPSTKTRERSRSGARSRTSIAHSNRKCTLPRLSRSRRARRSRSREAPSCVWGIRASSLSNRARR